MPTLSRSAAVPAGRFSDGDFAFAMAWEVFAPGLGGWTVTRDVDEDETEMMMVDPPLVYGDGFVLRPMANGVQISSPLGVHVTPSLPAALLLICPLPTDALAEVERLAAAPTPGGTA